VKIPRALRLIPPIAVGVAVAAWLISTAEPPARVDIGPRSTDARTVIAQAAPLRMVVRGYGNARAARSWEAIAEVSGAIVWRHPDLDAGRVLAAGTTALRIDQTAYELAIAQAEADLAALRSDLAQLDTDAANTGRLLDLERDRLALAQAEHDRIAELVGRGVASQSALDTQARATLLARRGVEELSNAIALIPTRRTRLEAQVARTQTLLDRARRDLEKTVIVVPFDLRIGAVSVEKHQFVAMGQRLISADDISRAEVTAQIPLSAFRRLLGGAGDRTTTAPADMLRDFENVSAELHMVADPSQRWQGRLVRIEGALDPQARSVPAVVSVDDPYAGANPPERLALVPNMFVELVLTGPETAPLVAIPDSAVHQGDLVYLRDDSGLLELRRVTVAWRQQGRAVISEGLADGDEVILDDLVPAIPGLVVNPVDSDQ
jgi:RND family efflux transporter MFP subunit